MNPPSVPIDLFGSDLEYAAAAGSMIWGRKWAYSITDEQREQFGALVEETIQGIGRNPIMGILPEAGYREDSAVCLHSRSYFFDFLPFYHMGVRATYKVADWLTATYALVNGVQQTEAFNGGKSDGAWRRALGSSHRTLDRDCGCRRRPTLSEASRNALADIGDRVDGTSLVVGDSLPGTK